MPTPVKLFKCSVTDNYGIPSPQALVAIRDCSFSTQENLKSANCIDDYTEELTIEGAAYTISYWHSEETKNKGYPSKPLFQEIDGTLTDVFTVDLEHFRAIEIMKEDISSKEMKLKLAYTDFVNRPAK